MHRNLRIKIKKSMSKLAIPVMTLLMLSSIGGATVASTIMPMSTSIVAEAQTKGNSGKSHKHNTQSNKGNKNKKHKKGSKTKQADGSGGSSMDDNADSSSKSDPMAFVVDRISKNESNEYTGKSSSALGKAVQAGENAFHRVANGMTGQSLKKAATTEDVVPSSPAGVQWSILGGKNPMLDVITRNSEDTNYSTLNNGRKTKQQGKAAEFGMDLNNLGLDHTTQQGLIKDGLDLFGRLIGGAILYVGDFIDSGDYFLFKNLMKFFNLFNPVQWMESNRTTYMANDLGLGPVADWMRRYFKTFEALGLMFAAFSLMFSLALAFFRNGNSSSYIQPVKRWLMRVGTITLGCFIILGMFQFAFNSVKGTFSQDQDSASAYAVYSTLINDKDWFEHSRLSLPGKVLNGKLPYGIHRNLPPATHQMALAVNGEGAGIPNAQAVSQSATTDKNPGNLSKDDKNLNGFGLDTSTLNMIHDWFDNDEYTAGDWESFTQSEMPDAVINSKSSSAFKNAINTKQNRADKDKYGVGSPYPYANNGTLHVTGTGNSAQYYSNPPSNANNKLPSDAAGGLSTLGMFNYLRTIFNNTSMTWTNSDSLDNNISAPEHKAVGMTGTGFGCFGNFSLMVVIMWAVGLLGFLLVMYDINRIACSILKLFGYGVGNAFGMMGTLQNPGPAIKFYSTALDVILSIVGTSLCYSIGRQIIIGVSQFPDQWFGPTAYNTNDGYITSLLHGAGMNISEAGAYDNSLYALASFLLAGLVAYALYKGIELIINHWTLIKTAYGKYITIAALDINNIVSSLI